MCGSFFNEIDVCGGDYLGEPAAEDFLNSGRSCNRLKLRRLDWPVSIAAAKIVTK